jgi:hypothetical protein
MRPGAANDPPDGHPDGATAQPPGSEEFRAHLERRPGARARLTPRHADIVDPHESLQFDGKLAAHASPDPAGGLQAATPSAHFDQADRNHPHEHGHRLMAIVVATLVLATAHDRGPPP